MSCEPCSEDKYKTKDPDSLLDYAMDWGQYWMAPNDTIQASEWIVPEGLVNNGESFQSLTTTVMLSGGVLGETYTITNRITTSDGRIEDASFYLTIVEN